MRSSPASPLKFNQRLHFLLSSFENSDAAERALVGARDLLADCCSSNNRVQARQALVEVLRGRSDLTHLF
jgi:hypothetical protein